MAQERIYWIDNLKGVLLLFVIIQHVYTIGHVQDAHPCIDWYLAFHMPAFFFLSGLLFNPKKYIGIKEYTKNKWRTLLKPYLLITAVFSFLDPKLWLEIYPHPSAGVLNRIVFSWLDCSPFWHGFITHLYSDILDIVSGISVFLVGPMWFLWALFGSSLLFFILNNIVQNKWYYLLILSLCCGLIGSLLFRNDIGLPFNLHVIITATFFYGMGFLMKHLILLDKKNKIIWIFVALFIYSGILEME